MPNVWPRLPKNYRKRHECRDKVPHPSLEGAQTHADGLNAIRERKFDAYQCHWCGYYHAGGKILSPKNPSPKYDVMQEELGDRVWFQMHQENTGTPEQRMEAIAKRTRKVYRRLGVRPDE